MPQADIMPPVIKLSNLTKRFGQGDATFLALGGIDLTIDKGEFVAIMGPSGCGKTTLLNILGLLDTSTEGNYELDGTSIADMNHGRRARIRGRQIGFVFQNFNLLHRMNVIENVALPLTYKGMNRTRRLTAASNMLKTFHLHEREYYMPHQLSGGQLQRVAIARALVNQPSIILADEPTGNLDSKSSEIIMSELSDIHKRGNTIIMVTHNPDLTVHASRVIQMIDGQIASDSKHPPVEPDPTAKRPLGSKRTKRTTKKPKKTTKGKVK
ncbi:ABC transporter-related protein [candidate division TM7 genomosp. GTL1]|nr:ABC transporter-related protein [candidate division TM7 genomosp. GTL1]